MLTKEAILSADDLQTKVVNVPEWGGEVTIREMTSSQVGQLNAHQDRQGMLGYAEMICALSLIDANGQPMFSPAEIKALGKKSGRAISRIVEAATDLNALTPESVDEIKKKSETIPANGSGTKSSESTPQLAVSSNSA